MASFNEEMESTKNKITAAGTKIKITKKPKQPQKTGTRSQAKNAETNDSDGQQKGTQGTAETQEKTQGTSTSITAEASTSNANVNQGEEEEEARDDKELGSSATKRKEEREGSTSEDDGVERDPTDPQQPQRGGGNRERNEEVYQSHKKNEAGVGYTATKKNGERQRLNQLQTQKKNTLWEKIKYTYNQSKQRVVQSNIPLTHSIKRGKKKDESEQSRKSKWMRRTENEYYFGDAQRADEMLRAFNAVYGGDHPTQDDRDRVTNNPMNVAKDPEGVVREEHQQENRRPRTESLVAGSDSASDSGSEAEARPVKKVEVEKSERVVLRKDKKPIEKASESSEDEGSVHFRVEAGAGPSYNAGRSMGYQGNNWVPNYNAKRAKGFWNSGQRTDPIQVFEGGASGKGKGVGAWNAKGKASGGENRNTEEQTKQ
ncbi:uncharacterized protein MELLADRAFT_104863 [Melampsora larici-populina 98AG31]|uniref:Uncharacterized protein n=1 Tax=Melampsora larici-populina (strain 98AG31 / pathotype 3-4-7) TaxID=747676 RepID=F4RG04_MELLP|nr:uncharacterized protein MELLADRAFT_104863 [Melampsora larici-populina 98AG31]EGG08465.1 hypothetical protein MELLADRAFT_104863 [Melampsora larici-populina 98AG31]